MIIKFLYFFQESKCNTKHFFCCFVKLHVPMSDLVIYSYPVLSVLHVAWLNFFEKNTFFTFIGKCFNVFNHWCTTVCCMYCIVSAYILCSYNFVFSCSTGTNNQGDIWSDDRTVINNSQLQTLNIMSSCVQSGQNIMYPWTIGKSNGELSVY